MIDAPGQQLPTGRLQGHRQQVTSVRPGQQTQIRYAGIGTDRLRYGPGRLT
ncbi:hypothetical protein [Streptomyces flaveus]|uniref:hypothetical protein n=1 Tax=Streptomyces flaveus TaxID=66370 RepID=UPI0016714AE9|nr:hypothetical protein [Streptomyces flaveus]